MIEYLKAYNGFVNVVGKLRSPIILALRLYWGWKFFQTGFGKFGKIEEMVGFFGSIGIPFPEFHVYLVASVETVGGLLLLVGLASRLAAIPLSITMIVAYLMAHREGALALFSSPEKFIEQPPFHFLLTSLIVLAFGAGFFSLDRLIKKRR